MDNDLSSYEKREIISMKYVTLTTTITLPSEKKNASKSVLMTHGDDTCSMWKVSGMRFKSY